jgi:hypothetical protein
MYTDDVFPFVPLAFSRAYVSLEIKKKQCCTRLKKCFEFITTNSVSVCIGNIFLSKISNSKTVIILFKMIARLIGGTECLFYTKHHNIEFWKNESLSAKLMPAIHSYTTFLIATK